MTAAEQTSTTTSNNELSPAEIAKKIKKLLKPIIEERADAFRLDELRRLFAKQDLNAKSSIGSSKSVKKWKAFLRKHFDIYLKQLTERMERKTSVRTFWGVIASVPEYTKQHPQVSLSLLKRWLASIPGKLEDDRILRVMVESEFLHQYLDVQYYSYIALEELAKEQYDADPSDHDQGELLFKLLILLPHIKSQKELDNGTYLFPPPGGGNDDKNNHDDDKMSDEDDDSDDGNETEESEVDDDDDGASSSSDDEKSSGESAKQNQFLFQYQKLKAHRKVMCNAWLAILRLSLPPSALKHALQVLPQRILPNVPHPLRFADFMVQAYNHSDGIIPVLALDGLFFLMLQCGLEYPKFYTSLYRLIQPQLFYVKYRIRFFELLVKCLTLNEMLPAHIVAAFCKRLLRASLCAPPSGCLFALALTSNMLRKHPECACLIHRSSASEMEDKFDAKTNDPKAARALESSLWELFALRKHYYPPVATLAHSVGKEDASTPMHDLEDFLRHTYKSLFDQDKKRLNNKRKKIPLAFKEPTSLFVETDVFADILQVPQY